MFSPNKFSSAANNSPISSNDCALRKRLETGRLLGARGDGSHMAGKQGMQRSDGEASQERGAWKRPENLLKRLLY